MTIGENNLSFIETSALDASNVELAFQNILTGMLDTFNLVPCVTNLAMQKSIASSRAKRLIKVKVEAQCRLVNAKSLKSRSRRMIAQRRVDAAKKSLVASWTSCMRNRLLGLRDHA